MAAKKVRKELNFKHILIHFVAINFYRLGAYSLGFLAVSDTVQRIRDRANGFEVQLDQTETTSFVLTTGAFAISGLLAGLTVSMILSRKQGWSRINSMIAFLIPIAWTFLPIQPWEKFQYLLWLPGSFAFDNLVLYYLINGLVPLSIGTLVFLLKPINKFIEAGKVDVENKFEFEEPKAV